MKIYSLFISLLLILPLKAQANTPFNLLEAVILKDDVKFQELAKNTNEISVQDFIDAITKNPKFFNLIADSRAEFKKDIESFLFKNKLNPMLVGYFYLKEAKDSLVRIAFVLELQLLAAENKSIHLLGRKNLENLNHAISELVTHLYLQVEKNLKLINFSKEFAVRLREDFMKEILSKRVMLSASEQWINESLGLDKNHIHQKDALIVIRNLLKDRRNFILASATSVRTMTKSCAQLFAI